MALLPIHPVTLPTTLIGATNGKLPSTVLTTLQLDFGDIVVVEATAGRCFNALFHDARQELGIKIKDVGGYRSYQAQVTLFTDRYKPVSHAVYLATPSDHRKRWPEAPSMGYPSEWWIKKNFGDATAAAPGTSNHGWGLAIDIAQEYDNDTAPDPITEAFVNWLIGSAWSYGVSAELQSEKWHWRYCTGDAIPDAVLAFEGWEQPPQQEDDVKPIKPQRAYDSRPGSAPPIDTTCWAHNVDLPRARFNPGESRDVFVGLENSAFVVLTAIGDPAAGGHLSVNDPAGDTAVVGYSKEDRLEYIGVPAAVVNGHIRITAHVAPCDVIVDVHARWNA